MSDLEFKIFMDLLMCSDPWPMASGQDEMEALANKEAVKRGFPDWVTATHLFKPEELQCPSS